MARGVLGDRKFCYYVTHIPNGAECGRPPHHFVPGIVVPDEAGYYVTDWDWGADREVAAQCADELNRKLGLTDEEASLMVAKSMSRGKLNHA